MDNADDKGACVRPYVRMHTDDNMKSGSSDPDYTSSSEQSCDTVIYVGHLNHKEIDFTDNEGPPSSLPIVPKSKTQSQSQIKNESSTLERKRHNSFSKNASEDQRKADDKSSSHPHSSDTAGHHQTPTKQAKGEKLQQSIKGSPLLQRHQPVSTQTQCDVSGHGSKSAQNSPLHAQKKTKHRTSQSKQDQGTDAEVSQNKGTPVKTAKPPSDETWIDGPRFAKPKFDAKTLHQLQKEQWVDGPPNMYGFMDHHKQNMIQRWIEQHSHQIQNTTKKKNNEVWIDYPPDDEDDKNSSCSEAHKNLYESGNDCSLKGEKCSRDKRIVLNGSTKNEPLTNNQTVDTYQFQNDGDDDDHADSASNSADVDETDNEENAEASGYDSDLHILQLAQNDIHCLKGSSRYQENYGDAVETIEVMEPDEPVPMVDSCMQVSEEEILAEYWMQNKARSSENPLPEVDQSGYDSKNHPLRILSEEDLNLASSFTDSRSVSVDLDSISVPDTCREGIRGRSAITWHLLYGNMFQRIKEQQQRQRRNIEDISSTNSEINDKLERIAKLRELIQPLTKIRNQTPVESIFKTCSVNRLPLAGSRYTMSEMLCNSRDSSMEDLSQAEVTSTQSEPADLDLDKYDYRANIKPMNGLKLEAFYKKIQKVPPFLEQYSTNKPTQIVSPLSIDHEKSVLISRMETQRSENVSTNNNCRNSPSTSNRNSVESFVDVSFASGPPQQTNSLSRVHKNASSNSLQREPNYNISESLNKNQKSSGDTKQELKIRTLDRRDMKKTSDENDSPKRIDSKSSSRSISNKNIDTTQLTVGQSPSISPKSRLYRNKSKVSDLQNVHSQQPLSQSSTSSLWSKESSKTSSPSRMTHRSPAHTNSPLKGSGNKFHGSNGSVPNNKSSRVVNNASTNKLPARSSPTSSSTSGVTTTCCATMKQKDKHVSSKSKQSSGHNKQKHSQDRKAQRSKSICRSTSSPSTCVDSGDTVFTDFTDSEQYHAMRHASISGNITSPYHKVPQVHVSHHHHHHHQRTSSGHGSESSVNSIEPREAKELLIKGTKTQQFSGTSSGYESMLRDSEGTPLSSSQESGEDTMGRERGRKGRRKSQGN